MWDKNNYASEADKQLSDTDVNRDFKFNKKLLQNPFEKRNENLKYKAIVIEKELKYFTCKYKKAKEPAKI